MSRGNRLPAAQQDSYIVRFFVDGTDDTQVGVTTTTETNLSASPMASGNLSTWTAPWPCRVAEVFVESQLLASGDASQFRVRRNDLGALSTADDVISNGVGTSAVDYVILTSTAANQYQRQRYTGDPDVEGISGVVGFVEAQEVLAAGDRLTATYKMAAAGDSMSHVRCIVTVNRI